MINAIRHRALGWWAGFVCRRPWWVLFVATVATVACVSITYERLEFQSDRNALLSMSLDWNRRFEDWRSSFPGHADLYIVVDAGDPATQGYNQGLEQAQKLVDELGPTLEKDPSVLSAVWGFNRDGFSPRAVRMLPIDQFKHQLDQIAQSRFVLSSPTPTRLLAAVMGQMQRSTGSSQAAGEDELVPGIQKVTQLVGAVGRVLESPPNARPDFSTLAGDAIDPGANRIYLTSENGRLLFIRVTPRKDPQAINALSESIAAVRTHIDRMSEQFPSVEIGLTGIDVVETDETAAAIRDTTIASAVAAVLITAMLILAFNGWRVPLLAMIALLVGIAWSFGFLTLAVGHLQVLSVVFAVILLGLGIAFGTHIASQVEQTRHLYPADAAGFTAAMQNSLQTVGPGVITGAVTTAAAFCTTLFTDFRGVAEMGLIAGAGILLCLLAMLSVFPALLRVCAPLGRHFVPLEHRRVHLFEPRWVMPFVRHPRLTLLTGAALTGVSLIAATQMSFDFDLLKLQPRGVDSVMWQNRVTNDGGESIWAAVSIVDSLDEARTLKARLMALDNVGQVKGIGLLTPDDEDRKLQRINSLRSALGNDLESLLEAPIDSAGERSHPDVQTEPGLVTQLSAMQLAIQAAGFRGVPAPIQTALDELNETIIHVMTQHTSLPPPLLQKRQIQLDHEYDRWRRDVASQVDEALDTSPLTPADVPHELLRPYIADGGPNNGRYALEIHPRLPDDNSLNGPLDPAFLPGFISTLEQVNPDVTGVIVQIYRSGYLILNSYRMAGLSALVVVFLMVLADFGSLRAATLSLIPVAAGFAVTFGIMWLMGMSVNPANIIVLPLMFGIGVDSCVHMLHRYRQDPVTRPLGLSGPTGKGITITSLTTMIGFGSMLIARHRGIAGLGFVMTTGIGLTMLACWTLVPAWLQWRAAQNAHGAIGETSLPSPTT